jgi:hypothetical protein
MGLGHNPQIQFQYFQFETSLIPCPNQVSKAPIKTSKAGTMSKSSKAILKPSMAANKQNVRRSGILFEFIHDVN